MQVFKRGSIYWFELVFNGRGSRKAQRAKTNVIRSRSFQRFTPRLPRARWASLRVNQFQHFARP